MDVVYTFLTRRAPVADQTAEVSEAVDVLWAHAEPDDRLEHAGGRAEADRLDLLLFFLPADGTEPDHSAEQRAVALMRRAHRASPLLRGRYLTPPEPGTQQPDTHRASS
ncbi:hypothetical protein [Streptacidiphilus rugosus]|uniref:hypothetical protein n=1 Tax=Streptacidiphilus rugosus TaxID=405783 RepID=UPI0005624B99|nr:hypothetical protein [Streptacidiphilus rugosus]